MSHMRSRATRWFLILVVALFPALALGAFAAPASAAPVCINPGRLDQLVNCVPTASVIVNDISLPLTIAGGPKAFSLTVNNVAVDGAHVSLTVRSNADPFIDYAIAVKNDIAVPVDFDFNYVQPFVGGPYTTLTSSHSGSVTDSSNAFVPTNGSVTIGAPEGFVHRPSLDGATVLAASLNTGCVVATGAGGSSNCPPTGAPTLLSVPVSTGATGLLDVEVHFTLSPGDIYTTNGRVELFPAQVPEPATLLLLAVGAFGVAVRRRGRA